MLMTIVMILLALWVLGFFAVQIGGGMIHVLLVVALVVFIYDMVVDRQSAQ